MVSVTITEEIFTIQEKDKSAIHVKEEDTKMENVAIKEEISTIEDMCTVNIKEEDNKMENVAIKEEMSTVEDTCTVYIK